MTNTHLHGLFHTRNQQAFQRALSASIEASAVAPSKSSLNTVDVNAKDELGRTVLHLACSAPALECTEYVRLMLRHPGVHVNLVDRESGWTALHRAMYAGNLGTVLLLLQRPDIDTAVKDLEGYTAFDLYNSTVEHTKPSSSSFAGLDKGAELFTWGTNRNAALGHGDASDRSFPDQVTIPMHPAQQEHVTPDSPLQTRFTPIQATQIAMSKLHTVVVTDERIPGHFNVRVCGFGNGGRLGASQHTQYSLIPLPPASSSTERIEVTRVALGQDHTLLLTASGEVYSWGLNRFAQLGYIVEGVGANGEVVQTTPKRVMGPLRREEVVGVAACKTASACWTGKGEVWTWGTNGGQLGYDSAAQRTQVLPRRATRVTKAVVDVAMTEGAMCCVCEGGEVVCVWRDAHFRINFPTNAFPTSIQPYRPPQSLRTHRASIAKIVSNDDSGTFAALTSSGEVFTFSMPSGPDYIGDRDRDENRVRPQMVWALRKQFAAATDVALGGEGVVVLVTESGHVFVRNCPALSVGQVQGKKGAGGGGKWTKVSYVQRAVGVCANATGAFGVLREGYVPPGVVVNADGTVGGSGKKVEEDMKRLVPFLWEREREAEGRCGAEGVMRRRGSRVEGEGWVYALDRPVVMEERDAVSSPVREEGEDHDVEDDREVMEDVELIRVVCRFIRAQTQSRSKGKGKEGYASMPDVLVRAGNVDLPAHRVVLAARSAVLARCFDGQKIASIHGVNIKFSASEDRNKLPILKVAPVHALSLALLLVYLYTDDLPSVWDRRVSSVLAPELKAVKIKGGVESVRGELVNLVKALELDVDGALGKVLEVPVKRGFGERRLGRDLKEVFCSVNSGAHGGVGRGAKPDVVLKLAEGREVHTHEALLRSRSRFFDGMFREGGGVWVERRRVGIGKGKEGVVEVDLRHMRWSVVEYVMRWLVGGEDEGVMDVLPFVGSVDELVEFVFEVMGVANELLLDRLVLICSSTILRHLSIHNAVYILAEASFYNATALMHAVQSYVAVNMETFLEHGLLDELANTHSALVKQLSRFVRERQEDKMRRGVFEGMVQEAVDRNRRWIEERDVPEVHVGRLSRMGLGKRRSGVGVGGGGKMSTSPPTKMRMDRKVSWQSPASPQISPIVRPLRDGPAGPLSTDDLFMMDEEAAILPEPVLGAASRLEVQDSSGTTAISPPAWKPSSIQKVDMKTLMAEAEAAGSSSSAHAAAVGGSPSSSLKFSQRPSQRERRRVQSSTSLVPETSASTPPAVQSSPWKSVPKPEMGGVLSPPVPSSSPPISRPTEVMGQQSSNLRPAAPMSSSPSRSRGSQGELGPVFTPSRQQVPSTRPVVSPRRSTSGAAKAWTLPPVQPTVTQTQTQTSIPESSGTAESSSSGMSFVAIQQLQLEQGLPFAREKEKRSLMDIQKEEREKREEEEFLRWWAEEEGRVKRESEMAEREVVAATAAATKERAKGGKRGGKGRGGRNAGVGGGHGDGQSRAPRPGAKARHSLGTGKRAQQNAQSQ